MKDLEQEFQKLMQETLALVLKKVEKGELTADEGYDLHRMIQDRTSNPNQWHDTPDKDAWSQSTIDCMEYERHMSNGWEGSSVIC